MSATRIIIFAKAPVPGKVKTRLIPALGGEGAAQLAQAMLVTAIQEALAAAIGKPELCADPSPLRPVWTGLVPTGIDVSAQGKGDLGQRLARAARRGVAEVGAVILIGTDCPALNRHALREIARELASTDAVIYPARDGGYVALGLRKYDPSIFEGIAWSDNSVSPQTIDRVKALGWSLHVGPVFRDIDLPIDLAFGPDQWVISSAACDTNPDPSSATESARSVSDLAVRSGDFMKSGKGLPRSR